VLNEPETSLHPDLLPALARLVLASAERTQTILVTHSQILLDSLDHERRTQRWRHTVERVHLVKSLGETGVDGREGPLDSPRWAWAKR
jgi:predicted ATPase